MKINTTQLLEELYTIDPSLRKNEDDIKKIIEQMLEHKPTVTLDQKFVSHLRRTLLSKEVRQRRSILTILTRMTKKPLFAASIGALGVAAITLVVLSNPFPRQTVLQNNITQKNAHAFGVLTATPPTGQMQGSEALSSRQVGFGGGGLSLPSPMVVMPPSFIYSFKYTGDALSLGESTLPVYRYAKENGLGENAQEILSRLQVDTADLSKFPDLAIRSLSLIQKNKRDAYEISLQPQEGWMSIHPFYETWYPTDCGSYSCALNNPLTEKDVPSDSELISIASIFLDTYGIYRYGYGNPSVLTNWRDYSIMTLPDGTETTYIPDVIPVVFPVLVDGQPTHDMNGNPQGLRVDIDLRKKKVQSVTNITNGQYERSDYEVEQNPERIIKFAERGGFWGDWYGEGENTKTLELGTPERMYIEYYQYGGDVFQQQKVYIPALRFPVLNTESQTPKFSVVPLVKEMLDEYEKNVTDIRTLEVR